MKTKHNWKTCAHTLAEGMGVVQHGEIVSVWTAEECRGLMGAHEVASEFAYEFGGHVEGVRKNKHHWNL